MIENKMNVVENNRNEVLKQRVKKKSSRTQVVDRRQEKQNDLKYKLESKMSRVESNREANIDKRRAKLQSEEERRQRIREKVSYYYYYY